MVKGWAETSDGRHHGAHGGPAARALGLPADDFLDFSQNVNPLGPPAAALAAARRALETETGRYPDPEYLGLREALAGYLGVPADTVLPANGGAEALFLVARVAGGGKGRTGRALILEPTFSEYAAASHAAGLETVRRVVRCPENGFHPDLSVLGDPDGFDLVFLCNPNNPTGEALGRAEVLEFAGRVREAGATLVVDEAFADFAPGTSVADQVDGNLLVVRSFTKFFAVPGLRLGCLVTSDPARAASYQPSWPVNAVAAAAGEAAVLDHAFVEATLKEIPRLRESLFAALDGLPDVEPYPGAANYLLVRGPADVSARLAHRGVLVRGCEPFAGLGAGYFRVAVRGSEENANLVSALRQVLREEP